MKYVMGSLLSEYSRKEVTHTGQFITTLWIHCIGVMNSTWRDSIAEVQDVLSLMSLVMRRVSVMARRNIQALKSETSKHSEVISLHGTQFCRDTVVKLSNRQRKKQEKLERRKALEPKLKLVPNETGKVEAKPISVLQPFEVETTPVENLDDLTMMQRWMRGY
jgi:hypothetical protein